MKEAFDSKWQVLMDHLREHYMGTYLLMRSGRVRSRFDTTVVEVPHLFYLQMLTGPIHGYKLRKAMQASGIDPTQVLIRLKPGDDTAATEASLAA